MSEEERGLPNEIAEEFFTKKEEMQKEKEKKEQEAAEKRAKIASTLEKHIETKSEQQPPEE